MNYHPLISIITVSYNSVQTIEETILSVINQTYSNIEYIIIDGGSNDGTVDIINKYSNKIAYWISEPDKGIYDAMNKGALKASGDYVQYLNSSDRLYGSNIIESIMLKLSNNTYDVIYGDLIMEKEFGKFHMVPLALDRFKDCFPLYHPSTWVKTSILKKYLFDTKYKIAADYDLLRKLYFKNISFKYIPLVYTIFEGYNGISSTNLYKGWIECQYITKENQRFFWPIKKFLFYIKNKIGQLINKIRTKLDNKYKIKNEYKHFIKDKRIINIIECHLEEL